MVINLQNNDVTVVFYRLRRVVFRVIVGVCMHPTSFHNCTSEEDVYRLIKTLNETSVKLEQLESQLSQNFKRSSVSLTLSGHLDRYRDYNDSIVSTDHNELGSRYNWLSKSFKQN